jgi:hypothetical protein
LSAIRDFVMAEPLFDMHEHQNGFTRLGAAVPKLDFRVFLGYADADLVTAAGQQSADRSTPEGFFNAWQFARTTGYGQATEAACKTLLKLDFTLANTPSINAALQAYVAGKSPAEIYDAVYQRANVRWAVCDECWDSPTVLDYFDGREHPRYFGHALRCDAIIALNSREQVRHFERVSDRSIHQLSDLDRAMDDYADRARQAGKLSAFKCGLAYNGTLVFENTSQTVAEPIFQAIMQNRDAGDIKPLTSYLFHRYVQRAADFGLPLQVHTGYLAGNWGNPTQGDPTALIPVFQRYCQVRFDLFHAGWPWSELMGAIGKAFPNVYLDMCWAWSMDPVGMERTLDEWLSIVPNSKLCAFGGDTGLPFAMLGYAVQARRGIANVLERKLATGEYDLPTAQHVARRIMHANAQELYPDIPAFGA